MSKTKIIITLFCILATAYTLLVLTTYEVKPHNTVCGNPFVRALSPWSAGCYYSALFDNSVVIDTELLSFEGNKLNTFVSRGGVTPDILWYRLKLHQKYRNHFRTNFRDLHSMYQDYLSSQHILLDRQTEYFYFLESRDLIPLAQQTLNSFCDTYILVKRESRIEELKNRLSQKGSSLSLEHCKIGLDQA